VQVVRLSRRADQRLTNSLKRLISPLSVSLSAWQGLQILCHGVTTRQLPTPRCCLEKHARPSGRVQCGIARALCEIGNAPWRKNLKKKCFGKALAG
jgi:hypothetical protein